MARYIDGTALLNKYNCGNMTANEMYQALVEAPSVDVAEVKHGEWIEGKTLEKCSVCGKKGFPDWRYCPRCGAKMDGGKKE